MAIKGVAFDLEGTVINLEHIHDSSWAQTAKEFGIPNFSIIPHFLGTGDKGIASKLQEKTGMPAEMLIRRKRELYTVYLSEARIESRPGFLKILEEILSRDLPISIGSLTPRLQALHLIQQAGIDQYFPIDRMIFEEDVQHVKPSSEVYLATAQRMGIDPKEQLVFEDSIPGIQAAHNAHSVSVGMPVFADRKADLLRDGAVLVFESWEDVHVHRLFNLLNN